jgi:Protein of unknown function (DUF3631)
MSDDLRGILNAGHTRDTAYLVRAEGDKNEPRVFSTWAPKAVAAIGRLPDTIEDRAVRIVLSRKSTSTQTDDAFDTDVVNATCVPVRKKIARFVLDQAGSISFANPKRPDGLDDRAWSNWKPLFAIADVAGGSWPERVRQAALALGGRDDSDSEDVGTLALRHIWEILNPNAEPGEPFLEPLEAISTADLVGKLTENEEGPWAKWWAQDVSIDKIKAPASALAKILKPFGIKPDQVWIDGKKTRGYRREHLETVALTYLEIDGRNGSNGRTGSSSQAVPTVPTVPTVLENPLVDASESAGNTASAPGRYDAQARRFEEWHARHGHKDGSR